VARYWSINTTATAVLLSQHPSAITNLAAAILEGEGYSEEVFCRPSTAPVVSNVLAMHQYSLPFQYPAVLTDYSYFPFHLETGNMEMLFSSCDLDLDSMTLDRSY